MQCNICLLSINRNCGNVFCKDCCHLKLPIPDQQLYDPVLVCNTCYDLLLESRTREIRSQQLKKAIATASSWAQHRVAWPDSALSCSFWAPWPLLCFGLQGWGDEEESLLFFKNAAWKRRCTVRLSERRRRGSVSEGGFPTEQTPSVQRHFSPGICSGQLPPRGSVL